MNNDTLAQTLAQMPFLNDLPAADIEALAAGFEELEATDGHTFFSEGAHADGAYLVLQGTVVASVRRAGEVRTLRPIEAGELFGTIALLDNQPRSATCVARGRARVARIRPAAFWLLAKQRAQIAFVFQRALARQLAFDFRGASARAHQACAER